MATGTCTGIRCHDCNLLTMKVTMRSGGQLTVECSECGKRYDASVIPAGSTGRTEIRLVKQHKEGE